MSIFEILLILLLGTILSVLIVLTTFFIRKMNIERKKSAILSHRELWLYYMDDKELSGLLSNNNGKGIESKIDADNLTEKQYRFLVLFLNHMESMLPSWNKYKKDWIELFKNLALRKVYENTKLYRNKKFCALIDGIINNYEQQNEKP